MMKLQEIMSTDVRCVKPDDTLVAAAGLMKMLDVGAVPICDNDRLGGMLTDRDITVRAVAEGKNPQSTKVREVMSEGIVYIFEDEDVEGAARLMREKQMRRLPVLNREKRLVGMVSLGDLATRAQPASGGDALKGISED